MSWLVRHYLVLYCRGLEIPFATLVVGLTVPLVGLAQDALQSAATGDQAYRVRNAPTARQYDQLRAGPVQFGVGLSYSLDWNDNVNNVETGRTWDIIHRPQLNLSAAWPPTQDSRLSFAMGLGYSAYTRHPDLDRLYLSPNSELAWDIPVKDFVFTLYDRFSYSEDVLSQPALSGTAQFPRFDNTAGVRASWQPDKWFLQGGYGHENYFSSDSDFDYVNRTSEQFFARAGYQFAAATQGGVEASAGLTRYDSDIQTDNDNVSVGPYLEWQITEAINLGLRGGYVFYSFQGSPATGSANNLSSYYTGVDARQELTSSLSHALGVSHGIQQGFNRGGQYVEYTRVNYNARWAFYRYASLFGNVFYNQGKEPQPGGSNDFDQYGFGVGASYQITEKLPVSLTYRHTIRDSNQTEGDYQVNQVILQLQYWF